MADLRGALLAAAEEADKMQQEIANLRSHAEHLECENIELRIKLKNAAEQMMSAINILLKD
jgi:hypothetical protein